MPFVFDTTQKGWPDDGSEPPPPKLEAFVYETAFTTGGRPAKMLAPANNPDVEDPKLAEAILAVLKAVSVAKVLCRYDGGNDEGFAWVSGAELADGNRVTGNQLAGLLIAGGLALPDRQQWQTGWSDERRALELLDYPLATDWAAALLGGRGFGTGEYYMYGAFVADLQAATITDDPNATPEIRNIEIDGIAPLERDA
jgi:hypothetical protein